MTSEYLLQAMGLIDDDLIAEAERPPVRHVQWTRRLSAWAAGLVLCVGLGTLLLHALPLAKNSSGQSTASTAPTTGNSECSTSSSDVVDPSAPGSAVPELGLIYTDESVYSIYDTYTEVLPEGSREVGVLSVLSADTPYPATDAETYAGCPLWQGPDGRLYVGLPGGGWAAAELVQP